MEAGSIVVLHLLNPSEKYFGVLHSIGPAGITMRGINLSSFEDWMRVVVANEIDTLGPNTVFFPLLRIERIFLDEPVGRVESLSQIFERRVGQPVREYLEPGHKPAEQSQLTH